MQPKAQTSTRIMGILNVTPDSFSDGGTYLQVERAVERGMQMVQEGADYIDIGGESSKPGAVPVSAKEELDRVLPVIKALSPICPVPISIDTYKAEVADAALAAGASIINDISGLRDPDMVHVAAKYQCPVIIMHMQGTPSTMQKKPRYDQVVEDVYDFFVERIDYAKKHGVKSLLLDPGIGFGKTLEHNMQLLAHIDVFCQLEHPVLVGVSRKSFIKTISGAPVEHRLPGSIAAGLMACMAGARILRTHDVRQTKQALDVYHTIADAKSRDLHTS